MRIVKLTEETTRDILVNMLKRSPSQYGAYEDTVKDILEDVKTRGDEAVFAYTEKFDHAKLTPDNVRVSEAEIEDAYHEVDEDLIAVIRKALLNIRAYHEKQRRTSGGKENNHDKTVRGRRQGQSGRSGSSKRSGSR